MMRKRLAFHSATFLIALCLALLPAGAQKPPAKAPTVGQSSRIGKIPAAATSGIRHVFIVSVDGMMPETYLQPDAYGLKVPTLREIAANGAYSEGLVPVFPPVT